MQPSSAIVKYLFNSVEKKSTSFHTYYSNIKYGDGGKEGW
jgi:hypothetical protein